MFSRISSVVASAWVLFFNVSAVWADGAVPAGTAVPVAGSPIAGAPSGIVGMMPFVLMFGVIYFLMIRPQQKKAKEQIAMLSAIKPGDEVITSSGMLGTVTALADKLVTLEVDSNVRVKMLKSQIAQVVKGPITDLTPSSSL